MLTYITGQTHPCVRNSIYLVVIYPNYPMGRYHITLAILQIGRFGRLREAR